MGRLSAIAAPSFGGGRTMSASQGELAMSASEIATASVKRKAVGSFNGESGARASHAACRNGAPRRQKRPCDVMHRRRHGRRGEGRTLSGAQPPR
jgi:hypothetical protein